MKNILKRKTHGLLLLALLFIGGSALALPEGFVYLDQIDPSIQQDIRSAGDHKFVGRPIKAYEAPRCILTKPAAGARKDSSEQIHPHIFLKFIRELKRTVV